MQRKQIILKVEPDFHKKLKVYLAEKELTLREYVVGLIEKDMKEHAISE